MPDRDQHNRHLIGLLRVRRDPGVEGDDAGIREGPRSGKGRRVGQAAIPRRERGWGVAGQHEPPGRVDERTAGIVEELKPVIGQQHERVGCLICHEEGQGTPADLLLPEPLKARLLVGAHLERDRDGFGADENRRRDLACPVSIAVRRRPSASVSLKLSASTRWGRSEGQYRITWRRASAD